MNREALENLILESTGRSDKLTLIRSAINIALEEVSGAALWNDLRTEDTVTAVGGEPYVDLAEDAVRVAEVRRIEGLLSRPLLIRPKTWLVTRYPSVESMSNQRPVYGYITGQRLYFVPIPDVSYDITYTYFPLHPELTNATDEVLIRAASTAVIAFATFWVFQSIEMSEDAKRWFDIYQDRLKRAIKIDGADSAVKYEAEKRSNPGTYIPPNAAYWLDPFVRRTP